MYTSFGKVDKLSTTRHLKFGYISILTNLLRTGNETKSVKTIYTRPIIKDEKDKEQTQKKYKNATKEKRKNSPCTSKAKEY